MPPPTSTPSAVDLDLRQGRLLLGNASVAVPEDALAVEARGERREEIARRAAAAEDELRRALAARFPGFGAWSLFSTHGAAVEAALAATRRFPSATPRTEILRFRGCRHDVGDEPWPTEPERGRAAVVRFGLSADVDPLGHRRLRFNDSATLEAYLAREGARVAAVIVEPIPLRMGLAIPAPDFLPRLRAAGTASGARLVFDEGASGLRFGARGSGERLGVEPDAIVFGDALAAGLPFGAVAWRRDEAAIGGAPPGAAAVLAARALLAATGAPGFLSHIDSLGARLARGLEAIFDARERAVFVDRVGSVVSLVFPSRGPSDPAHPGRYDWPARRSLAEELARRGVRISPHPMDPLFVAASHDADAIDRALGAFRAALGDEA